MTKQYNDPAGGNASSVGPQIRIDMYERKALTEAAKEMYFSPLADVTAMPKHMGKTIKRFHYLPVLDDRNINDQGIDANGVSTAQKKTIFLQAPETAAHVYTDDLNAVGYGADATAATTAAQLAANDIFKRLGLFTTDYATSKAAAIAAGWTVDDSIAPVPATGNLYGSSKDVGTITGKLPVLGENGGKVNRIGHTRIEIEGTFQKFGFHDSYTKESLDFDTDAELEMHVRQENIKAANEIYEDTLQIDLLNNAGIVRYAGSALSTGELSGETGGVTKLTYEDLQRVSIDLDQNRCPKNTKVISGSRMIDTKTINSARVLYIGSELQTTVEGMVDQFGNPAFVSIEKYAAGTTTLNGEIGSIYQFRVVVVPEMMHWAGVGATVTNNAGYRESAGKYNVYPALVVGDGSFTTIGFQSGGKGNKFKIKHSKPETSEAYSLDDPFGEKGFHSIKWHYGFMVLRAERIALLKTVAPW